MEQGTGEETVNVNGGEIMWESDDFCKLPLLTRLLHDEGETREVIKV